MTGDDSQFPEEGVRDVVRRVSPLPPGAHRWVGNGSREQADHHQSVNAGSGPFFLRLEWMNESGNRSAHVGDFRIDLRALAFRKILQEKGKMVRLRFVRRTDGLVVIQANNASPAIAIGWALFDA